MQVKDVMTRDVETIDANATVDEAAKRMKDLDVGPLPVVDGGQVIGMVTDRDIVVRAVAEGRDPTTVRVREVMTPEVFFCFEEEDVRQAAQVMQSKQIRRLVVLDRQKRLAGIVALADLAIEAGSTEVVKDLVEDVSQPPEPT